MLLQDKVVIVSGGARGIGAAICRVLGRHGAKVVVNYSSSKEKADSVAAEIVSAGGSAVVCAADVRLATDVQKMVDFTMAHYGRVDGIVHNAISGKQNGPILNTSEEDYNTAFDFGCHAVIHFAKATRPIFNAQGGGRIVNICTELWNSAPADWTVYMSGKGAMVGISRSLARELGPENITVNCVAPGWMADEKVIPGSSDGYAKGVPLRRQGSADEIGNACVFYLSDLAGFVTGTYLPVCGGNVTQVGV